MTSQMNHVLSFYAQPDRLTDPREHADLLADLPSDLPSLCALVQGVMVHIFWAERYGLHLSPERASEVNLRRADRLLARMRELDARPLSQARDLEKKLVGNCRDFSVLLTTLLRYQGVPARARCGFGTYFIPGHYEDHWCVETWRAEEQRWVMVDAQLDALQREGLGIDFDPCDMPAGKFITGGLGWKLCRSGQADADHFGIADMHGLWFVRGDLVRDLAALNRREMLPWDGWGLVEGGDPAISADDLALLDRAAELTLAGNDRFDEMRALYEGSDSLRVPATITCYGQSGFQKVTWEA